MNVIFVISFVLACIGLYLLIGMLIFMFACYVETEISRPSSYIDKMFTDREGNPDTFPGVMSMLFWPFVLIPVTLWAFWHVFGKKFVTKGHRSLQNSARRAKISPEDKADQKRHKKELKQHARNAKRDAKRTEKQIKTGKLLDSIDKL